MESASLALSVPRLHKPYFLGCGIQRQRSPLVGGARYVSTRTRTQAIEGAAADLAPVQITWQITVGALGTFLLFHMSFFIFVQKMSSNFSLLMIGDLSSVFCAIAAGAIPFLVAGIEFSKRIVSQD
jgi:hypothetical protein